MCLSIYQAEFKARLTIDGFSDNPSFVGKLMVELKDYLPEVETARDACIFSNSRDKSHLIINSDLILLTVAGSDLVTKLPLVLTKVLNVIRDEFHLESEEILNKALLSFDGRQPVDDRDVLDHFDHLSNRIFPEKTSSRLRFLGFETDVDSCFFRMSIFPVAEESGTFLECTFTFPLGRTTTEDLLRTYQKFNSIIEEQGKKIIDNVMCE